SPSGGKGGVGSAFDSEDSVNGSADDSDCLKENLLFAVGFGSFDLFCCCELAESGGRNLITISGWENRFGSFARGLDNSLILPCVASLASLFIKLISAIIFSPPLELLNADIGYSFSIPQYTMAFSATSLYVTLVGTLRMQ